jgi:putative salt-induced outer membrane protein YdiY
VETADGVEVRPRETLWAIVEGGSRELDYWSATLDLGLSANRGNSNQVDFILGLSIVREDRRTLHELAYTLVLGRAEGEQTVSRHLVLFRSDVWMTDRFFVNPVVGQLLSDRFQDITFRAQPAAGGGVRFLHTPNAWWDISLGLGYQYNKLTDPLTGIQNPQNDGIVRFATRARFDITEDIYLLINWATNLTFTKIGNTNHSGTADLLIEVTNVLNLNASFLYLRTEEPQPRSDGTFPVKNDYLLIFGLTLELG